MAVSRAKTRKPAAPRRAAAPPHEKDGRERILAVAIRSFSEQGYEGTTTAGIAREVGVTQPLVHHHFGSRRRSGARRWTSCSATS